MPFQLGMLMGSMLQRPVHVSTLVRGHSEIKLYNPTFHQPKGPFIMTDQLWSNPNPFALSEADILHVDIVKKSFSDFAHSRRTFHAYTSNR